MDNIVMKPITLYNEHTIKKKKMEQKTEKEMKDVGLPHTREPSFTF